METSVNKEYDKVTQNGVGKSSRGKKSYSTPWDRRRERRCLLVSAKTIGEAGQGLGDGHKAKFAKVLAICWETW
jgi:hypothetical protein